MRLRLTLPLALAASCLLIFLAAPAQAAPGRRVVVRALAAGGPHPLPLAGARVTVLSRGRIVGRGRTGSRGISFLRARSDRGGLLLRVSGGSVGGHHFGGRMEAFLRHYAWPRTAEVNTLTTLATRFAAARGIDERSAARRVRKFLRLPPGFQLGLDGRTNFAFDGRRFLRATDHGGYDALIARLLRRMAKGGAHRSFHPRHRHRHPGAAGTRALLMSGGGPGAAPIGEALASGTGFFEALEDTDYVLDFADAVMDITGLGSDSASAGELREVSVQLQRVEEEVAALRAETQALRSDIDNSTYGIKAERSLEFHEGIEAAEDSLQTVLQAAEQAGCTKEPVGDPAQCEKEEALLESDLETYGSEGPATAGKLRTYADYIAGYAAPEGGGIGEGLLQAASHLTTNASAQAFYTATESRDLASFADYWLSNYAEGLVLAPLYAHVVKGAEPGAVETEAEGIAPYAKALVAATPRPLAAGTVIDMRDGTMWPTEASAIGTGEPWSWFVANGGWRYVNNAGNGPAWRSTASGAEVPSIGAPPQADVPNEDWQVAGAEQVDSLLEATDPDSGQTAGEAVLEEAGIQSGIIIPPYGGYDGEGLNEPVAPGRGLEMEYQYAGNLYEVEEGLHINSGCYRGKSSCFWPIWVGDNGTVANFNRVGPTYRYVQGTFEVSDPLDISWYGSPLWGYDNEGGLFGNDPVNNIPNLFFRSIGSDECYYYPGNGQAPGSPGCPQGG